MNLTSTDEKRACFLASTPLQLICCSEAREHYKITHPLLVMVKPDNKPTVEQMKRLAERLGWEQNQIIWMKKNLFYLQLPLVIKKLKKISFDYIFTGNLGSWAQEVIFTNLDADMICVDDGMATIFQVERFRKYGFKTAIKNNKRNLLKFIGVNVPTYHEPKKLHYYSFFGLESDDFVTFDQNELNLLKKRFERNHKKTDRDAVGFIGQPFKSSSAHSELRKRIEHLMLAHSGMKFVYFPHRKENINNLRETFSGLDVEIFRAEWPIEIEIAKSPLNFRFLYSYISTALFTIKNLLPSTNVYQVSSNHEITRLEFYEYAKTILVRAGIKEI